jgi:hypothetical protein
MRNRRVYPLILRDLSGRLAVTWRRDLACHTPDLHSGHDKERVAKH